MAIVYMKKNTVFGIILFVVMFWFGLSSCIKNPIREVCICKGDVCKVESYNINFKKSKKIILKKDIKPKTLNKRRKYSGVDIITIRNATIWRKVLSAFNV